ncbi:Four helix bundle protein [Flavobacterium sp. 9AF]|uniref:four helix bundle protein n=1 Tax=Flavobacterium sp. 9AF TaxID=2653142 RepID=UPI0012F3C517|nr:four helix bundle protein [Flavobacterium sp. 9AF]VXB24445.1 Four helix bundle protein [Flavobacterium sp. 9AF]
MAVQKFEDLIVWQKSQDLAVEIYSIFRECKDFAFKDQITRATVSISNNIAEGFERSSNADFTRFLFFSLGSVSEVRSMLYLAIRLNFVSLEKSKSILDMTNQISKMLYGLINSMNKNTNN